MKSIFALAVITSLSLPVTAAAQRGPGPHFRPEMIERIAGELGVSDKTLGSIKDSIYKAEKEIIGLEADLKRSHLELRSMMDADRPSIDKVMKQVERVGELETKVKKNRVRLMLTVRGMLTAEQRHKLQKVMHEHRSRRGEHTGRGERGERPGKGPGPRFRGGLR